ncbi:hypothetical protein IGI04_031046 [Brassica rapa subsp. trilocularis]|uniref:Uncharacterized protein n=1 Tax=Brassica rapa subsp. trilocularis TaxID=1813537 RepID=A0ABQ7LSG8_BRACM|nr:hypothetical protein IGI04_031046 [Brassica rapa subsp. trilocularis]
METPQAAPLTELSVNKAHSQILSSPELVSHAERQLKEAIHEVLYKFLSNRHMCPGSIKRRDKV